MAAELGFYHCTRQPAGEVAVRLAARAHAGGERLLVLADGDALDALDRALWVNDPASFLPHGRAGTPDDPDQPILLADGGKPVNGARLLMLLNRPLPAGFDRFARTLLLFDDGSDAQARARLDWKAVQARENVARSYWQQTPAGGWQRKA